VSDSRVDKPQSVESKCVDFKRADRRPSTALVSHLGMRVSAWFSRASAQSPRTFAGLIGAVWGVLVVGLARINPFNIEWLRVGDLSSAYTNLMYFRQTSWWQWPITSLPNYGVGWSTMFNESGVIPLGLVVKLFDPLLPMEFQYFGLWVLACFVLQGVVACVLLTKLNVTGWCCWVGVLLFVTSPILSFRFAQLGHQDLVAHWLILLALVLYLDTRLRVLRLTTLLLLALSINAYIFVIVASILIAHLIALLMAQGGHASAVQVARGAVLMFAPSAVAYAAFGYLSWGDDIVGVGQFRLSLGAFVARDYGGEEFAYLGLGSLVAIGLAAVSFVLTKQRLARNWVPLVAVAVALFMVALSNEISLGVWSVEYPLPDWATSLRQVVRVANRLAWLPYYLLVIAGIAGISRMTGRLGHLMPVVLIGVVVLQLSDRVPAIVASRTGVLRAEATWSVLQDPRWATWQKSVDQVVLYPVFDVQGPKTGSDSAVLAETQDWFDIMWWAAEANLPTNFSYRSRPVGAVVERENDRLRQQLTTGKLDERAIYITASRDEWRPVVDLLPASMDTVFVDGLYVIYPIRKSN